MMSLKLKIALTHLKQDIPYKYTVFSPKTRNAAKKDEVYESIGINDGRVPSSAIINRVLHFQIFEQHKGNNYCVIFSVHLTNYIELRVYFMFQYS